MFPIRQSTSGVNQLQLAVTAGAMSATDDVMWPVRFLSWWPLTGELVSKDDHVRNSTTGTAGPSRFRGRTPSSTIVRVLVENADIGDGRGRPVHTVGAREALEADVERMTLRRHPFRQNLAGLSQVGQVAGYDDFTLRQAHHSATDRISWQERLVATSDSPVTRASLLVRLRDRTDQVAWSEFVELYSPVIYGFARKRGLQDADAADLMQDVLRSVTSAIERLEYDPKQGSFRGWLFTITRNKVFNHLSARKGKARGTGDSVAYAQLAAHPDQSPDLDAAWEQDYQRQLTSLALNDIRGEFQPKTWEAFWRTAVEGESAGEVGGRLAMSAGAVYVAKSRVLARLKDEVQRRLALDEEE